MSWAGGEIQKVKSGFALMELSLVAKERSVLVQAHMRPGDTGKQK